MCLLTGEAELAKGADKLHQYGPQLVLVSRGEKGAFYSCHGFQEEVSTYGVNVIDTTGAGDAFFGAVLYCIAQLPYALAEIEQEKLREIVRFANAAGSLTTTKLGAIPALPSWEEIRNCRRDAALKK